MDTACKKMKTDLLALIQKSVDIRSQINVLRWKPGSEAIVKASRAKDASGRKTVGKKALKAHRRPETGQERYCLWYEKRSLRSDIRELMLAYGLLRGAPYKKLEAKCDEGNAPYVTAIVKHLTDRGLPITKAEVTAWLEGGPAPSWKQAAAA